MNTNIISIIKIEINKKMKKDKKIDIPIYKKMEILREVNINYKIQILSSNNCYEFIKNEFENLNKEIVFLILVDTKNQVIQKKLLSIGTIDFSIVDMRDLFKEILLISASGFFLIHNHPSGDVTPSDEDLELTNKINQISKLLNLRFLDHLIVNENNFYSMYDNNLI